MRFEPAQVARDDSEGVPSIRVEPNRPYVLLTTVILLAVLVLPIVFQERLPIAVIIVAIILLVFGGFRFVILIGPARLLGRPWVAADGDGISARNRRGVVRYGWERVISVTWTVTGLALARWTVVEVTPKLGDPESPYGPMNPDEIANLWFLSSKRLSSAIGGDFLSVCRHYGSKTQLFNGLSPIE
ncbi:MAG: hypothetical protein ACRDHC_11660 [Actinomycetota bacterium]